MPGKGQSSTAQNGPDWQDVLLQMRVIQDCHNATIQVKISTDGTNYSGTGYVRVIATLPVLDGPGRPMTLDRVSTFPCVSHRTVEGCVSKLLHDLDVEIGRKSYRQAELPLFRTGQ